MIPHGPRHHGVPSGASKMISEPMVHSAQTVHLSCVKTSTISKRTESIFHLSLITWEYHWLRQKRFLSLWCVRGKSCTYLALKLALCPNRLNRALEPHHLGVSLGASKMISEPIVCLMQTMHLSCTETNTVSKRTRTRFHMTQVT
jgi:hypothetical protein